MTADREVPTFPSVLMPTPRPPAGPPSPTNECATCGRNEADCLCTLAPAAGAAAIPRVASDVADDRFLGTVLDGRYRVESLLGQGGMGRVYAATQLSLGQRVAIKVILPGHGAGPSILQRFRREAMTATRLTSPHVVRVYDFAIEPTHEMPFIVMELLRGHNLRTVLQTHGALSVSRSVGILIQVMRALVEAQDIGLVHRDIKPDNLLLVETPDGSDFVKLMDFGIARTESARVTNDGQLTVNGQVVGTPHYMSPEQACGSPVDFRSDLYAVGCLLTELITGRSPFDGEPDHLRLFMAHLTSPPPALPERGVDGAPVPRALRELQLDLLAKSADDRPSSCRAVLETLQSLVGELAAERREPVEVRQSANSDHAPSDPSGFALPGDRLRGSAASMGLVASGWPQPPSSSESAFAPSSSATSRSSYSEASLTTGSLAAVRLPGRVPWPLVLIGVALLGGLAWWGFQSGERDPEAASGSVDAAVPPPLVPSPVVPELAAPEATPLGAQAGRQSTTGASGRAPMPAERAGPGGADAVTRIDTVVYALPMERSPRREHDDTQARARIGPETGEDARAKASTSAPKSEVKRARPAAGGRSKDPAAATPPTPPKPGFPENPW
jgi:serine/threonine protein kinase